MLAQGKYFFPILSAKRPAASLSTAQNNKFHKNINLTGKKKKRQIYFNGFIEEKKSCGTTPF